MITRGTLWWYTVETLTIDSLDSYRALIRSWMEKLDETGEFDEHVLTEFAYLNECLNISIAHDNCEPLSGNLEILELQPSALELFKQLSIWAEITFYKQNKEHKKSLH